MNPTIEMLIKIVLVLVIAGLLIGLLKTVLPVVIGVGVGVLIYQGFKKLVLKKKNNDIEIIDAEKEEKNG